MTVQSIYEAVRLCFDEEAQNQASFVSATDGDMASMNNIIKSHIGDALRWVCLYAPAEMLTGSDTAGTDTGIVYEGTITTTNNITDESAGIVDGAPSSVTNNRFVLPANFIRLVRVRATGWHRAVSDPLKEDSEEYLQLHDPSGANATADRPQAAIINKQRKELEVWPSPSSGGSVEFTCIVTPLTVTVTPITQDTVPIPPLAKGAFIYYLAFLTLSAYADVRAPRMLEIAKMNLGLTDDKQRA